MLISSAFAFVFLLAFSALLVAFYLRGQAGALVPLRDMAAIAKIRSIMAETAEDGRPVHVALGTAGIADGAAMQTLAGLTILEYLSDRAVVASSAPLVTTAHPLTLGLAQTIASRPFRERDHLAQFDPLTVRFSGGSIDAASAYAAGVIDLNGRGESSAQVLVGNIGDEVVLLNEAAARSGIPQISGTANLTGLPFLALNAPSLLLGEELFAAGAYLSRQRWPLAALHAEDAARWIIAGTVLALVIIKTLGVF